MNTKIKPYMHPKEVFKILANWEAEIEHSKNYKPLPLPKNQKVEIIRNKVGWQNFVNIVRQLQP